MQVQMTEKEYYIYLRKSKKISLDKVGKALGISKVAVHYYENGTTEKWSKQREQQYREFIESAK